MVKIPIFLLVLVVFTNRYVAGYFFRALRGRRFDEAREGFEPTVTVVVPVFNEGRRVYDTVQSLLGQAYPPEKLSVIVVDDSSSDDSFLWAQKAAADGHGRVRAIQNPGNVGKRRGINNAVRQSDSEIIVSVDSDVIVDRQAVRMLVARFVRPRIAAVGGRVNVLNANENWLTKMQTIKYFFGYEFLKNLERSFSSVMCLSGCLTAYRRQVLVELEPILERRNMFDVPIKYGEDRFLTRQIIKAGHETVMTLDAVSWTVVPSTLSKYFSQQLRWRRSNLVDMLCGVTHAHRLHPVVAIHYLSLFAMLLAYPLVILTSMAHGSFLALASFHVGVLALLGAVYWVNVRHRPAHERVHPLWFIAMAVVMPVTYLAATPLALFTLDSASWETRGQASRGPGVAPTEAAADSLATTLVDAPSVAVVEPGLVAGRNRLPSLAGPLGSPSISAVD